jgi:hypothetical protein
MNDDIRLVTISAIKIGNRHRKDLGDLSALAVSIAEKFLQLIGVTPDLELIWGYRRLLAIRDVLRREEILCQFVSVDSIVQGEIDENTLRKDFSPSERVAIVETLRGYEHGGDRKSDQSRNCDLDRLTTKEAAERVGFCRDDYYRAKKVVAQGIRELVEAMDAGKLSISAAGEIARTEPEVQRAIIARDDGQSGWVAKLIRREKRRMQRRDRLVAVQTTDGQPWRITSQQAVIPCDAVITDPPFGVTKRSWDQDIERTTRAWASAWNESEAHFICTFFAQNHLFESRRWFEESLTSYEFVQLLVASYPTTTCGLLPPMSSNATGTCCCCSGERTASAE